VELRQKSSQEKEIPGFLNEPGFGAYFYLYNLLTSRCCHIQPQRRPKDQFIRSTNRRDITDK
jgi:hypothetical protein